MSMFIYNYFFGILAGSILLPALLCLAHYLTVGPIRLKEESGDRGVLRFNIWERLLHLIRLLAFLGAIISGPLIYQGLVGRGLVRDLHSAAALLFIIASAIALVLWFRDMLPRSYDIQWMMANGGYFAREHPDYPASRFNAGQKAAFWLVIVLAILAYLSGSNIRSGGSMVLTLHICSGLLLLAVITFHAYLATLANPGTFRVIIDGKVTEEWARHHHSEWDYPSLTPKRKPS